VAALEEGEHPASALLVVDDVHLIDQDEAIVVSLAHFLKSLPDWLHVVLLSRRTPKLPIDRLRARGQLGEVAFAELRFSDEEAEELLARLVPSIAQDELRDVVGVAGGWAAGLQLTALAARSEQAQPSTPPHSGARDLLFSDYRVERVLSAERQDVVDALLDTSVVTRINPHSRPALTGAHGRWRAAPRSARHVASSSRGSVRRGGSRCTPWSAISCWRRWARTVTRSCGRPARARRALVRGRRRGHGRAGALLHAGRPREALRLLSQHVAVLYDTGREATIARTLSRIPQNARPPTSRPDRVRRGASCSWTRHRFLESVGQPAPAGAVRRPATAPVRASGLLQAIAATITGDWAAGSRGPPKR
jgi:LuxR family maltose regulon positive regulatory protein